MREVRFFVLGPLGTSVIYLPLSNSFYYIIHHLHKKLK
nr:MAG TPA: hypothetical protein [Caudoviricetes sp.]